MNEFITVNAKIVVVNRQMQSFCTGRFDFSQEVLNSLLSELGFWDIIKNVSCAVEKYPLCPTQDVLIFPHLKNWEEITYLSSVAQ